jgi:succinate-semialdehyde dehydrogenase / glutarate-semialdehyde dehydrogenase
MTIDSVNPATGETIARYDEMDGAAVGEAIEAAHRAFLGWRETSFAERSACLRRAAERLRAGRDDFAALMAREMGKPIAAGRAEADKCAWVCEHYAEHAEVMLADQPVETEAHRSFVTYQPLGVVLAVMPWNFPFWQVFRFAAPGLMAGNAPSSSTPRTSSAAPWRSKRSSATPASRRPLPHPAHRLARPSTR